MIKSVMSKLVFDKNVMYHLNDDVILKWWNFFSNMFFVVSTKYKPDNDFTKYQNISINIC